MSHPPDEPVPLTAGPVLGLVAILLASIFALILLDSAWTLGGAAGQFGQSLQTVVVLGPLLALLAPAVLVLGVVVPALILRWTEPATVRPWPRRARSTTSTVDP